MDTVEPERFVNELVPEPDILVVVYVSPEPTNEPTVVRDVLD